MNIYLACTVRGDRSAVAVARAVADAAESRGHVVLTRQLLSDEAESEEGRMSEREVFERDVRLLDRADVLIAEASGSSYGVGFEVGYVTGRAAATGQRVLLLYDESRRARVSRLISGNSHPACTTYPYRSADDLLRFLEVFLAPVPGC
jgi:nucleoside 2-deoxyribosyltransferase